MDWFKLPSDGVMIGSDTLDGYLGGITICTPWSNDNGRYCLDWFKLLSDGVMIGSGTPAGDLGGITICTLWDLLKCTVLMYILCYILCLNFLINVKSMKNTSKFDQETLYILTKYWVLILISKALKIGLIAMSWYHPFCHSEKKLHI